MLHSIFGTTAHWRVYRKQVLIGGTALLAFIALLVGNSQLFKSDAPHVASCAQESLQDMYDDAKLVFRGKVVEIKTRDYIVVRPTLIWKGTLHQSPLVIHYADFSGSNRVLHEVNKSYNFFLGKRRSGELVMEFCTFSARLQDKETKAFLKGKASHPFSSLPE